MFRLSITPAEADDDIRRLEEGKNALGDALNQLYLMKSLAQNGWRGNSANRFIALIDNYIGQAHKAQSSTARAQKAIAIIKDTYSEADNKRF